VSAGDDPQRILVVLPNWLGDVVMAGPCLRALRGRYPDATIDLLGRPTAAALLDGAPWFDGFVPWRTQRTRWRALVRRLRRPRYDLAVLLTNSFRSALVAWLAGARRRVGYRRSARGPLLSDLLSWPRQPVPQIDAYLALAAACGCEQFSGRMELFVTPDDRRAAEGAIAAMGSRPRVLVNPGSQRPSKRWPADRFAAVADALIDRRGADLSVVCGPGEESLARAVAAAATHRVRVLDDPIVPLGGLKALIGQADLLVSNDSGPYHVARAMGTPVVAIFGPVGPEHTAAEGLPERAVYLDLVCSPCHKDRCPLGHHRCMLDVTVEQVTAAAEELLDAGRDVRNDAGEVSRE